MTGKYRLWQGEPNLIAGSRVSPKPLASVEEQTPTLPGDIQRS